MTVVQQSGSELSIKGPGESLKKKRGSGPELLNGFTPILMAVIST